MDLTWKRATVEENAAGEKPTLHRRVRVAVSGTTARMLDQSGAVLLTLEIDEHESSVSRNSARFVGTDGTIWLVEKAGCNCGGG